MATHKKMRGTVGDPAALQYGTHTVQFIDARSAVSKAGNPMAVLTAQVITDGSIDYGVEFVERATVTEKAMWKFDEIWHALTGEVYEPANRPAKLTAIIQQLQDDQAGKPPSEVDTLRLLLRRPFRTDLYGEKYTYQIKGTGPYREAVGIRMANLEPLTAPQERAGGPPTGQTAPAPTPPPTPPQQAVSDDDIPF